MPNSNIEIITPADGRGETRNFLLVCAAVLICAISLLSLLHSASPKALPELPNHLSNLATQVSNAVEEIELLEQAELINAPYQLADLPFPTYQNQSFTQQDEHCFSLFQGQYVFVIERHEEGWDAHWAPSEQAVDCHASLDWHSLNQ